MALQKAGYLQKEARLRYIYVMGEKVDVWEEVWFWSFVYVCHILFAVLQIGILGLLGLFSAVACVVFSVWPQETPSYFQLVGERWAEHGMLRVCVFVPLKPTQKQNQILFLHKSAFSV